MSGHSHWASIRHKKKTVDAKRGKIFSKVSRFLMVAARDSGGDPNTNLKLQYAIDKAREVNMPRENVDKAIKKGTGEDSGNKLETAVYEGYGPSGVAVMVEVVTDNRNRTVSEIRKIFNAHNGNLGESKCVSWLFQRKGFFTIPANAAKEDEILSTALEVGAEDAELVGDVFEITSEPQNFDKIKQALNQKGFPPKTAEITQVPKSYIPLDQETGKKVLALTEALEEHDDVQNVYANFDISEEVVSSATRRGDG